MDAVLLLLASLVLLVWCYTTGNRVRKANLHIAPADVALNASEVHQTER
jgi:hypothetical protein